MKTLYLVRHASASIDAPTKKDIDRPLNHAGISEAEIMAAFLRKQDAKIDQIISSPARRAIVTSQIIAKHFFYQLQEINVEEVIFLNDIEKILPFIYSMDNSIENILFVGHNPSVSILASLISAEPVPLFKPAGIACIEFEIEMWNEVSKKGTLKFYADPSLIT